MNMNTFILLNGKRQTVYTIQTGQYTHYRQIKLHTALLKMWFLCFLFLLHYRLAICFYVTYTISTTHLWCVLWWERNNVQQSQTPCSQYSIRQYINTASYLAVSTELLKSIRMNETGVPWRRLVFATAIRFSACKSADWCNHWAIYGHEAVDSLNRLNIGWSAGDV